MNRVTFAQLVEKRVAKDFDIVKQDGQYYVHPTFCISNLSDYIRIITVFILLFYLCEEDQVEAPIVQA